MINPRGEWTNSPAYDVVFNHGLQGEHTMDINAKRKNFTLSDLNDFANIFSISKKSVANMISDISDSLSRWVKEANQYNIPKQQIDEISKYIKAQNTLLIP